MKRVHHSSNEGYSRVHVTAHHHRSGSQTITGKLYHRSLGWREVVSSRNIKSLGAQRNSHEVRSAKLLASKRTSKQNFGMRQAGMTRTLKKILLLAPYNLVNRQLETPQDHWSLHLWSKIKDRSYLGFTPNYIPSGGLRH